MIRGSMKNRTVFALLVILVLCGSISAFAQDTISVKDIKGIWFSCLLYNEANREYEALPSENSISFWFTEGKGKLNPTRHTGLYRIINGGHPHLFYYSIEDDKVILYDSSNTPLSYWLVVESLIPKVSMTATLFHKEETNTVYTKMKFLFYEKQRSWGQV